MKILITTVAGIASRFNKDLEFEVLKCIYYKDSIKNSILYQILKKCDEFDEIVIVGGYKFNELQEYISNIKDQINCNIRLINNPHFNDYGSGYSLYLGLKLANSLNPDSIVFAEGDLYFNTLDFNSVIRSSKNVVTYNELPIESSKSVVLYISSNNKVHYIYDTNHKDLFIEEPFKSIYNSAQIWKFSNIGLLKNTISELTNVETQGTNLELINKYFSKLNISEIDLTKISEWINCNTILDYNLMYQKINTMKE